MGLTRSTFYDEPTHAADDTAIVEAIAEICDESSITVGAVSVPLSVSRASSSTTRRSVV